MSQVTIKQAISHIGDLKEDSPLLDVLRPWMIITGLELKDAIHVNFIQMLQGLKHIYAKLGPVVDVMEEDQLQEASCRYLGTITVYGDFIEEGGLALQQSQRITWQNGKWHFTADPSLRQRGESSVYLDALKQVKEGLEL